MPFVTTLTLTSGDRHLLDDVVDQIKEAAARKGVELKGPHPHPPEDMHVPQLKALVGEHAQFDAWNYTVYERTIEIVGHDEFARSVAGREFPDGVHVSAEVEQQRQTT
ncbi:uS10/mL48 family ribosomal protein [Halorientalis salina]|uniref:uS10/mL48 family ribosomal protein n=1 Tax=Halorientalis salina TaxID=2932266 RepID=UPI0010AB850E|nr:uS10/mL48 family ribosomal protein [Halorientalis salina]